MDQPSTTPALDAEPKQDLLLDPLSDNDSSETISVAQAGAMPLETRLDLDTESLYLTLPSIKKWSIEDWEKVWPQVEEQIKEYQDCPVVNVIVVCQDQLLGGRELQQLADILNRYRLKLQRLCTSRRQTAIAAASAGYSVEQNSLAQSLTEAPPPLLKFNGSIGEDSTALYVPQTIRSGVEIRHQGSVIVAGDINPGGSVIADNDIVIWGCLRGVAHAGATGQRECRIMALQMQPTQLRIADVVARPPAHAPDQLHPEVAYLTTEGIRLAPASKFAKNYVFLEDEQNWEELIDPLQL